MYTTARPRTNFIMSLSLTFSLIVWSVLAILFTIILHLNEYYGWQFWILVLSIALFIITDQIDGILFRKWKKEFKSMPEVE